MADARSWSQVEQERVRRLAAVYTDRVGDDRKLALAVLHEEAPGPLPVGRPSNRRWQRLGIHAGELARTILRKDHPGIALSADPVKACYLYLREHGKLGPRRCEGCPALLVGKHRRWCPDCGPHRRRLSRTL